MYICAVNVGSGGKQASNTSADIKKTYVLGTHRSWGFKL